MSYKKSVAVTGSSGKLGRAVVKDLLEAGWTVYGFDAVPPREPSEASFTRIDMTNLGAVVEALNSIDELHDGVDAVVHLAAIPGASHATNTATFMNNISASFNLFNAAQITGVKNVVWASSETVLGYPFRKTVPPYVPMDEEYPLQGNVDYSLSKVVEETIAEQLARRNEDLKIVGLRFSYVRDVEDYKEFPEYHKDVNALSWNMWSYIDIRDAARAVRLALEWGGKGFEAFNIAAADSVMIQPTTDLLKQVFPGVPIVKEIDGVAGVTNIEKALRVLGWAPIHSWRDELQGK